MKALFEDKTDPLELVYADKDYDIFDNIICINTDVRGKGTFTVKFTTAYGSIDAVQLEQFNPDTNKVFFANVVSDVLTIEDGFTVVEYSGLFTKDRLYFIFDDDKCLVGIAENCKFVWCPNVRFRMLCGFR